MYSRKPLPGLMLLVASRNAAFACAAVTETPGALPRAVRSFYPQQQLKLSHLTWTRVSGHANQKLTVFFETTAAARTSDRTFNGTGGEHKLFHCLHVIPNLSSPSFLH
jgi:hypothetical protein